MHFNTTQIVVSGPFLSEWRARYPFVARAARIAALAFAAFLLLPYVLVLVYRFVDPPFSALMLRQAMSGVAVQQQWVDFEDIAKNLPRMVVVSEDAAFCSHWGVDWTAVKDAIEAAKDRDIPRGASTIPMQTAKNLFLWPEQTYLRKALELPLAYFITLIWPKHRVMEVYLNIAEWGPGIFGVEAAARHHFRRTAGDLTIGEASLLAASLPNPHVRRAGRPGPAVRRLASRLQARFRRENAAAACLFDGRP